MNICIFTITVCLLCHILAKYDVPVAAGMCLPAVKYQQTLLLVSLFQLPAIMSHCSLFKAARLEHCCSLEDAPPCVCLRPVVSSRRLQLLSMAVGPLSSHQLDGRPWSQSRPGCEPTVRRRLRTRGAAKAFGSCLSLLHVQWSLLRYRLH
jgi:hypothetical protein